MWKGKTEHGLPTRSLGCALLQKYQIENSFREAVIRSQTIVYVRGKSGHHRAGFPVKTGGACVKASSRPVPQKTNRLICEVRVKRWGKSPPPVEQSVGHGKPNLMQDEIGNRAARLWFRVRRTPFRQGSNLLVR